MNEYLNSIPHPLGQVAAFKSNEKVNFHNSFHDKATLGREVKSSRGRWRINRKTRKGEDQSEKVPVQHKEPHLPSHKVLLLTIPLGIPRFLLLVDLLRMELDSQ